MTRFLPLAASLFVASVLCLAGCAGGQTNGSSAAGTNADVLAGNADSGHTIELRVGQTLAVRLVSNPSTGYRWQAPDAEKDGILASLGEPAYVQDPAPAGYAGVPGKETFRFEAKKAGTLTLRLVYTRPWEHGVKPAEEATFKVVVR